MPVGMRESAVSLATFGANLRGSLATAVLAGPALGVAIQFAAPDRFAFVLAIAVRRVVGGRRGDPRKFGARDSIARTIVQVLKQCGNDLTREM